MSRGLRLWVLAVLGLIVLCLGIDWASASARLGGTEIEATLDPASVVADGKSKTVLTVRVVENGYPRAHDLLQIWLGAGSGDLMPMWTYTGPDGTARITYTPNAASSYDLGSEAEIVVSDISIGRLVEVSKQRRVPVPLVRP